MDHAAANEAQCYPCIPSLEEVPGANSGATFPGVGAMVLRVLSAQLECSPDLQEPLQVHLLLTKYGVLAGPPPAYTDPLALAGMCRAKASEYESQTIDSPAQDFDRLAQELALLLGLDPANTALLKLGIAAALEQDLLAALEVSGAVPFERAVRVLANATGQDKDDLADAFETPNLMRESEYYRFADFSQKLSLYVRLPKQVYKSIRKGELRAQDIVSLFFEVAPPATLCLDDFAGHSKTVDVVQAFVQDVMANPRPGVNILLYGMPGTGKTQFVRALAEHLGAMLIEVAIVDSDGDPLAPWRRLRSLAAIQCTLSNNKCSLVLFDEVEDAFPSGGGDGLGPSRGSNYSGDRHKGWLTRLMDETSRPTFWLCNSIAQIEPAYLRRFDLVVEMRGPDKAARRRLVDAEFSKVAITEARRQELVSDEHFSPGHLQKLACVMADLQRTDASLLDQRAGHVIAEMRKAMYWPPASVATAPLRYRSECVQADTDLIALADGLRGANGARICLFGPPGTGKTEWAKFMAEHIGRPLIVRCGADLLGAFVGETEKRIRRAFLDAETEEAVLLVDEADSFLRDRANADRGWEVSMANQFLTSLEAFQGICVVSTNAMDRLDPASARRFDFKVNFSWLTPDQNQLMFEGMLEELGISNDDAKALLRVRRAGTLTPGDYAAVARQNRVLRQLACPSAVVDALEKEMSFKPGAKAGRRMGFIH